MRRATRVWAVVGFVVLSFLATPCLAGPLPQNHAYQKTLRRYFATLTEADFKIVLKPVTYVEKTFRDVDTLGRYWMFFLARDAEIPSSQGIRVSPQIFTLAALEAGDGVNMATGRGMFMDPKDVAWWTQWDYPGNPYFGSKPLKLRAFVAAAADMMMQDEEHEAGKNLRSDFLGGSMIRYAYTYRATKDAVPEEARQAYADGLIRMFEKLEKCKPTGGGGSDMEFFQLSAMWYAGDALGGDYPKRALDRAHVVIDTITSKTGYEKHGGAFDVSYQGIALRFLTWAALLYKDEKVNDALHKMLVLKSHLSLPEPDGTLFGPTHFNTGTAADAPNDQWAWPSRDLAMGMIDDTALYTIWSRVGVPNVTDMRATVKKGIEGLGGAEPSNATPGRWKEVHWVETLNFAFDNYQPGYYKKLADLGRATSPLTKSVFARKENFIRDLNGGGEFLVARFDDYAVIIHTGAIAQKWANGVSGKSGGGISAFWTPKGGTALLGRCRATQSDAPDEWTDTNKRGPYMWAVHAITGKGANSHYFSTARIRNITSKYEIDEAKGAIVTISGELSGNKSADPENELKGSVAYNRELRIDKDGIAITSGLKTDGQNQFQDLWEMIPIHVGHKDAIAKIDFRVHGKWTPATENPAEADQVRISRYGKFTYIVLASPQRLKLGGEDKPNAYGGTVVRNVMIDLTRAADKANPAVRYRLTATP